MTKSRPGPSHVADLIRRAREAAGLTPQALASRLGYRNLNGGARQLQALERECASNPRLLERAVAALSIDCSALDRARQLDERAQSSALLKSVTVSIEPVLTVRLMPAIYVKHALPEGVTDPTALEDFACEVARRGRKSVHLLLANSVALWINPEGEVYLREEPGTDGIPSSPTTRVGGKPLPLEGMMGSDAEIPAAEG